ncbi:MAG: aspartate-semialdehyde dehydrogenase [Nitrososphaerales archaeon]
MKKAKVAVLGATGMVGQQYLRLLQHHPMFTVTTLTGDKSVGKRYGDAANWIVSENIPDEFAYMEVQETKPSKVDADLVFSPLPSGIAGPTEEQFAKSGFPVISDASAHRMDQDVPLLIGEVNLSHLDVIERQKRSRKWDGCIITSPNCTTVGLALVLKPLADRFGLDQVLVSTMQALSGAGFPGVPSLSIHDNVIPYIEDEEEKVESEVSKILGSIVKENIDPSEFAISASCHRVPTIDGHFESVYLTTEKQSVIEDVKEVLSSFRGIPQMMKLPTAPTQPIIVRNEPDRPQPRLDRLAGSVPGMSAVVGRIRHGLDSRSLKFGIMTHNTIRGAAGGTILIAEYIVEKGMV